MESVMASLTARCQFQSWASKERNREAGIGLGREEDSFEKLQLIFFFFHLMLSGVILFS